jgi:hypothetical protein
VDIILFLLRKVTEDIRGIILKVVNIRVVIILKNNTALITPAEVWAAMDCMPRNNITNTTNIIDITIIEAVMGFIMEAKILDLVITDIVSLISPTVTMAIISLTVIMAIISRIILTPLIIHILETTMIEDMTSPDIMITTDTGMITS